MNRRRFAMTPVGVSWRFRRRSSANDPHGRKELLLTRIVRFDYKERVLGTCLAPREESSLAGETDDDARADAKRPRSPRSFVSPWITSIAVTLGVSGCEHYEPPCSAGAEQVLLAELGSSISLTRS